MLAGWNGNRRREAQSFGKPNSDLINGCSLVIQAITLNPRFKWVSHFLHDLRATRLEGAQQLLDILQAQERCHFRDLLTGDETWVYLDMKTGTIWLPADQNYRSVSKGQLEAKSAR
jgi:hypothetical protein